tara:strand:+ start:221 stop:394 length:174 start_codon:yes stop_codon:yes gene_type:complete
MDYLKKSLKKLDIKRDYEEMDTRIASGWYVNTKGEKKEKKYKTSQVKFTLSKKSNNP